MRRSVAAPVRPLTFKESEDDVEIVPLCYRDFRLIEFVQKQLQKFFQLQGARKRLGFHVRAAARLGAPGTWR